MAKRAQIKCINKEPRNDPYHRITHVGGGTAAEPWKITLDSAIRMIERGEWEFYTRDGRIEAKVEVATRNGHKYLKTENDRDTPDNLLSLDECP
jgi:hypothetical protein